MKRGGVKKEADLLLIKGKKLDDLYLDLLRLKTDMKLQKDLNQGN